VHQAPFNIVHDRIATAFVLTFLEYRGNSCDRFRARSHLVSLAVSWAISVVEGSHAPSIHSRNFATDTR
jgi:hypothetical protein